MPELPDITIYLEALSARVLNRRLERVTVTNPFLLRSTDPPPSALDGRTVTALRRLGKRIAIGVEGEFWSCT
jgi:formamidopyrimidine-DNA glycosylase